MHLTTIFLCDSAAMHPDKTFSILRGGIDRFIYDPAKGGTLQMTLVSIIRLETTETGRQHTGKISIIDMDGKPLIQQMTIIFNTPPGPRPVNQNILAKLIVPNPKAGDYGIYINVDGLELGHHPLKIAHHQRSEVEPDQNIPNG